jgi:diguanylate cyclase (GGDEF)-like protein
MISIKRYLGHDPRAGTIDLYRALLSSAGSNAARACQPVGQALEQRLAVLALELSGPDYPDDLAPLGASADEALTHWGDSMETYLSDKVREVKDMMVVLAETAGTVGERDRQYTARFEQLTGQLQRIGDLDDLTDVRRSLVQSAQELRACVSKLSQETQSTVARLRAEVAAYQAKLADAEQLASHDPLTKLFNRRLIDTRIAQLMAEGEPFCAVVVDLNDFKAINDMHGHAAGDAILKQFAAELQANARPGDLVGRLGGDEFVALLPCGESGATGYVERVRTWVIGDYAPHGTGDIPKIHVDAAVGCAEWHPGESADDLLQRADEQMYRAKRTRHR